MLLLAGTQAATFLLVGAAARNYAQERIRNEVEEATRVLLQFITQTVRQLRLSVRLLSSDYAFASTFARLRNSDDPVARATLESALQNYRSRIGIASFIRLISSEAKTIADTLPADVSEKLVIDEELVLRAEDSPAAQAAKVLALGDALHLVMISPLLAPEPSVWIAVGFPLDDALAEEFRRLSGFEIAFIHDDRIAASTPALRSVDLAFPPVPTALCKHFRLAEGFFLAWRSPFRETSAATHRLPCCLRSTRRWLRFSGWNGFLFCSMSWRFSSSGSRGFWLPAG